MATQQLTNIPKDIKSKRAGGVISAYRIIKFGDDDETVVQADAVDDAFVGITIPGSGSDVSGMVEEGDMIDFATSGIPAVEYGGVVTRGDNLTTDSQGRAITAGATDNVIGVAFNSGVSGDIGSCRIV